MTDCSSVKPVAVSRLTVLDLTHVHWDLFYDISDKSTLLIHFLFYFSLDGNGAATSEGECHSILRLTIIAVWTQKSGATH